MALSELYQQVIMKHYKQPQGFGIIPGRCLAVSKENPTCGDHFKLAVQLRDHTLEDVLVEGSGCAISVASCSMMVEAVRGKTTHEARHLAGQFLEHLHGREPLDEGTWGELAALESVKHYKNRISCADLAWTLLLEALPQA